jgi:hypothetical protein
MADESLLLTKYEIQNRINHSIERMRLSLLNIFI